MGTSLRSIYIQNNALHKICDSYQLTSAEHTLKIIKVSCQHCFKYNWTLVGYLVTVIIGVSQDEQSFQSKFTANILEMNAYLTRKIDAGIGRPLQNLLLVQSC